MSDKVGVYICSGCGIGQCVDVARLHHLASDELRVPVVRTSPAFCLEDVQKIKDDIANDGVTGAVIAACSGRVNTDVFSLPPASVHRVNLREQVAWSQPPNTSETQSLAEDYLRMGVVKAQKTKPPQPYTQAGERTVLVVGGGVAGISAALSAANAGFTVVLVEKSAKLGGYAAALYKHFPNRPPYRTLGDPGIKTRISEAIAHPGIKTFLSSTVAGIAGQPGAFDVTIESSGEKSQVRAGAVIMATGWKPYDAGQLTRYGLGMYPNVITSVTLEALAAGGKIVRPSDHRAVTTAAIILCEGPRDGKLVPYSGNVTSLVALKQAVVLREHNPQSSVFLFYQDMQTPGQYEYFYRSAQQDPGIMFSQGDIESVSQDEQGNIVLEASNTLLGGRVRIEADLLVLSTAMVPNLESQGTGTLNLVYLQGAELPQTQFGYADSHFICFPYETRRTGIYSAGCVRQPLDLESSARDGAAAALKAIQCIENSAAGAAVHPRSGDLTYPNFFMQKCTSCGRCSQECPFGAIELNEKKSPVLDPNRCRRCGICMGACPVQIISFSDYSVDMLSSMIRAVEIPEGDDEKLRILVLACENDAYPALDMAGINHLNCPANIRVLPVRCLGSVNSVLVADAVLRGFDGVALLGCKSGEDYQCHFIQGSQLLQKRMENIRETLNRSALEPERVEVREVAISDYMKLPLTLQAFTDTIKNLGPNPFKGF
ncbi:MAG TPA: FAD-dependent oxidoreductase [Bryobacteraceae bacterium]|nr:FAD-dependent oxidoreductase [Bryobacteraceae bacterium]